MAAPSDSQGLRFAAMGAGALALGAVAWFFLRPKKPTAPAAPPAPADEKPPPLPQQATEVNAEPPGIRWIDPTYIERWQLLQNGKWVGPEWFLGVEPNHPRVDALYIYTRRWHGYKNVSGAGGAAGWDWSLTHWEIS
jgi:hypothetical protein